MLNIQCGLAQDIIIDYERLGMKLEEVILVC